MMISYKNCLKLAFLLCLQKIVISFGFLAKIVQFQSLYYSSLTVLLQDRNPDDELYRNPFNSSAIKRSWRRHLRAASLIDLTTPLACSAAIQALKLCAALRYFLNANI